MTWTNIYKQLKDRIAEDVKKGIKVEKINVGVILSELVMEEVVKDNNFIAEVKNKKTIFKEDK